MVDAVRFVIPQAKDAGGLEPKYYFYIALKSFVIFLAWICSFKAIDKMPISLYGVLDLSRVLFATLLGVIVLRETLSAGGVIGLLLVSTGLLMLKFKPGVKQKKDEGIQVIYVIFAFASCMLNALSGLMDKLLMKNISSSQLQFWYMLFLFLYYAGYIVVTRTTIRKEVWKNGWIWLLSLLFVAADKALFVANGMEASRITVMTLIKQSGCIVIFCRINSKPFLIILVSFLFAFYIDCTGAVCSCFFIPARYLSNCFSSSSATNSIKSSSTPFAAYLFSAV